MMLWVMLCPACRMENLFINRFMHMFQSSWSDFADFEKIFVKISNTISGECAYGALVMLETCLAVGRATILLQQGWPARPGCPGFPSPRLPPCIGLCSLALHIFPPTTHEGSSLHIICCLLFSFVLCKTS